MSLATHLIWGIVAALLLVILTLVSSGVSGTSKLTVTFLNIGQGDAIFIESPSGRQMLVDGGPDQSVLRELSARMHWYDKSIDVVIATHPDADHISGLVDVLQRYKVDYIFQPGIGKSTTQAESMLSSVSKEKGREVLARRGQVIDMGSGVTVEILHPDRDVSSAETNEACIVARVRYGKTSFLLTCDAPSGVEKYLVALDPQSVKADVLKAGHHGSRTSSSELFVGTVAPTYGVFSRGCENRYGHPHTEVVSVFSKYNVKTLDTCYGRVVFTSDGDTVEVMQPNLLF